MTKRKRAVNGILLLSLLLAGVGVVRETSSINDRSSRPFSRKPNCSLSFNFETIINASDYPGDNDTERLQAALNDVPPEGAVVLIPPGIWTACGLIAKSRTVIQGFNGTVLERPGNNTAPFITFENRSEFAVFNVTFDSKNVPNAYGIYIVDSKEFAVSYNTFLGVKKSAVKVLITLNGTCQDFHITYNYFQNCDDVPIFLFGIPGRREIKNFVISDNTITNGFNNGKIGVAFSGDGVIANNTVMYTKYGIATRCVSNLTIEGNIIRNFTDYGIYLGTQIGDEGTFNIVIRNNLVLCGGVGITRYYGSMDAVHNVTITNNNFVNNTSYDITADFPALFINNVITSADKLLLLCAGASFKGTRTVTGEIVMPGDIDGDHKIDIVDVAVVALAYGTSPGDENWNPEADIITDQTINIQDVAYVAARFGSTES